ncbi:MFS transporter [Helicobacter sp. XJK30-2]|uniref:MFS transporter n=1 Tax=Helicobacter zhangjianzhongii TaxID=2974574 RepID=A0ACC6FU02_9HELI|nr:MFS transporter [Helicobacter sp. XJK30-2]MDL0082663.1 MFS transporter [Helicobacter sp. XJK30-2]
MFKAILPLSFVVFLRFLGLFIVLPVISLYVAEFGETSAILLGLAVSGAYLTQIIFQTPFGILSDKIDRKKVVMAGLLIFLIGSVICALADNIYTLILGRFIQGAGAIGGVVSAQITDLVREEQRTGAMAIMGGGIFASFTLAMLIGPIIGGYVGVAWLFWLTALLTVISMILLLVVPATPKISYSFKQKPQKSARNLNLTIMNCSSFLEKMFMTLIFVVIPLCFVNELGSHKEDLWKIYTPAALCGIFALAPASILAEKYGRAKLVLGYGVGLFLIAYMLLAIGGAENYLWLFVAGITLFFIGFATLEPIMQSLTSKYAKAHERGKALGVFTTYAYAGSFAGGVLGGVLYHHFGIMWIGIIVSIICVLWLGSLLFLANPTKQKNLYLPISEYASDKIATLESTNGIIEIYTNDTEGVIVLKYNSDILDTHNAQAIADTIKKPQ